MSLRCIPPYRLLGSEQVPGNALEADGAPFVANSMYKARNARGWRSHIDYTMILCGSLQGFHRAQGFAVPANAQRMEHTSVRLPEYRVLSHGGCLNDQMVHDEEMDLKLKWILYLRVVLNQTAKNAHFSLSETLANDRQAEMVDGGEFLESSQKLKDQSPTSHAFQNIATLDAEKSSRSGQ